MPVSPFVDPLVAEATKRSGVVWVALEGGSAVPVWHLWHDEQLWLMCDAVGGGLEQELRGAESATAAVVTVRSKATQNDRLVAWRATVAQVRPGSEAWDLVVPLLQAIRLNAPDGEQQPARWARSNVLLRLTPTGELLEPSTDPELTPPR